MTSLTATPPMTPTTPTTPSGANRELWTRSAAALFAGRVEEFLATWTPDGVYSVAYPVPGLPATVRGHEELRSSFSGLTAFAASIRVHDVGFHQTTDPAVAFVEERMVAVLTDGYRYENALALRVTFRDGLIAEIVEYYGELAHRSLVERVIALAGGVEGAGDEQ